MHIRPVVQSVLVLVAVTLSVSAPGFASDSAAAPAPQFVDAVEVGPSDIAVRATPTKRVPPDYPDQLLKSGVEGSAAARCIVTAKGKVTKIELVSSTHKEFGEAVVKQLKRWQFKPATLNGKPMASYFTLTQNFTLDK